jgi:tetratricopeptide (TPR) repeat protein
MKRNLFQPVMLLLTMVSAQAQTNVDSGLSLAIQGEYEQALRLFSAELEKDSEDPVLHYYVGMAKFRLGRILPAIASFEDSVARKATFPQVYFWLAKAYYGKGETGKSRDILSKGLEKFPRNSDLIDLNQSLNKKKNP